MRVLGVRFGEVAEAAAAGCVDGGFDVGGDEVGGGGWGGGAVVAFFGSRVSWVAWWGEEGVRKKGGGEGGRCYLRHRGRGRWRGRMVVVGRSFSWVGVLGVRIAVLRGEMMLEGSRRARLR